MTISSALPQIDTITQTWKKEAERAFVLWKRRRRKFFVALLSSTVMVPIFVATAIYIHTLPQPLKNSLSHIHALPISDGVPGRKSWRYAGWQSWQSAYQQAQSLVIAGTATYKQELFKSLVSQLDLIPLSRYPVPASILYVLQVHAYGHPVTEAAKRYVLEWRKDRLLAVWYSKVFWILSAVALVTSILLIVGVFSTDRNFRRVNQIYQKINLASENQ